MHFAGWNRHRTWIGAFKMEFMCEKRVQSSVAVECTTVLPPAMMIGVSRFILTERRSQSTIETAARINSTDECLQNERPRFDLLIHSLNNAIMTDPSGRCSNTLNVIRDRLCISFHRVNCSTRIRYSDLQWRCLYYTIASEWRHSIHLNRQLMLNLKMIFRTPSLDSISHCLFHMCQIQFERTYVYVGNVELTHFLNVKFEWLLKGNFDEIQCMGYKWTERY